MQSEAEERRRGAGRRAIDITRADFDRLVQAIEALQAEIDHCRLKFDVQFTRIATLQSQLDRLRKEQP